MKKNVPRLKTDQEAEPFLARDPVDCRDLKNCLPVTFELLLKIKQVNLRLSESLLSEVRKRAEQEGISYQKYIRRAVEGSLTARRAAVKNPPKAMT